MSHAGPPSAAQPQPYRLVALLARYGIATGDLRKVLCYASGTPKAGQPLLPTTMSHLLRHRRWPRTLDAAQIQQATAAFLRSRGVPDAEIEHAWLPEDAGADAATVTDPEPSAPEPEMLTLQAREHFHITRPPFIDDVQGPQDLFLSRDQHYVRESMYEAAKHANLIAVIGESGSGKSTLRRDLIARITRDKEPIVVVQPRVVDKTKLNAQHICEALIADLSTESPKVSLEAKGRQVERLLRNSSRMGNKHVLVIEEAHDLTNTALKYLKRFWEFEDGYRQLLGVVLIGQPELRLRLDANKNYDLREFINRCDIAQLRPLDANLEDYLALKFKRIGLDVGRIVDKSGFDAIRARLVAKNRNTQAVESNCYPLMVQNMLVKCMNAAAELGLPKVNADLVARI
jgi:type II secretory pathway predicted ATPase ExeA